MSSNARLLLLAAPLAAAIGIMAACGNSAKVQAKNPGDAGPGAGSGSVSVGVVRVGRKDLKRTMTISAELVPFQEIDVYAKESGYVKTLNVDYGTHVRAGQVMATRTCVP